MMPRNGGGGDVPVLTPLMARWAPHDICCEPLLPVPTASLTGRGRACLCCPMSTPLQPLQQRRAPTQLCASFKPYILVHRHPAHSLRRGSLSQPQRYAQLGHFRHGFCGSLAGLWPQQVLTCLKTFISGFSRRCRVIHAAWTVRVERQHAAVGAAGCPLRCTSSVQSCSDSL